MHLILVALHERYVVHLLAPNFTELAPRAAPKPRAADGHGRAALGGGGREPREAGAGMTVNSAALVTGAARGGDGDPARWWRRPARWRVMRVAERTLKAAAAPLNVTAVASVKPVPVTVTTVPTGPRSG